MNIKGIHIARRKRFTKKNDDRIEQERYKRIDAKITDVDADEKKYLGKLDILEGKD